MPQYQQQHILPLGQQLTRAQPTQQPTSATTAVWKTGVTIGVATFVVGVAVGLLVSNGTTSPAAIEAPPTVTVSVPATNEPAPLTGQAAAMAQDGIWLVGKDIQPGIYRSSADASCYWARLSNTSGDFNAILANGNGANQVVTISKTDKAFQSVHCAPWTKVR
jgi:hypothetical protein